MDLSLIEKDPAAFAAFMMAKPHGSTFTPPVHEDGETIDGAWCRANDEAVDAPFLIRDAKAAGLKRPDLTIDDVAILAGPDTQVPVLDAATQEQQRRWTLREWATYMREKTPETHKVLNILSLEVSGTRLGALVRAPQFVRDVDWVPKTPEDTRPKVRKYCLMSASGAFTDWHVDMGGTSVWYHVIQGAKVFWFAPPTPKNLDAYAAWISSSSQAKTWFGDILGAEEVSRISLEPGFVLSLPAGWLHAVYTPADSLVLGGNYLHSRAFGTQLAIFALEKKCRVDAECRFPHWVETVVYGAAADARHPAVSSKDAEARRLLAATLRAWVGGAGSLTASEKRRLDAAMQRVSVDFGALESAELGPAPKRTEDTLDVYVSRGLQVTAEERAEFLEGARGPVRASSLLRVSKDKEEDDWGARPRQTLYDSDDSDESDEDGTAGLGIAELKARFGVKAPREKRPAADAKGPKKRKKAKKAPVDKFARRRDPRLSVAAVQGGGAANDAEKRRREEVALGGARRRAAAMAAAERAVAAFDAMAWLEGARCATDASARDAVDLPSLLAKLEEWAAQHDGAPRGEDWVPPPLDARLDAETRMASLEAARLACETFSILNVDTLLAKLRAAAAAATAPEEEEELAPAPPRTYKRPAVRAAPPVAAVADADEPGVAAPDSVAETALPDPPSEAPAFAGATAAPPPDAEAALTALLRRRSDERKAEQAPIPTTAPVLAPATAHATLSDRVYAAVVLEADPWGRPLDEALAAKITGMITDAYNPPYVETLLVEGIGSAMDEAFSVLLAAGALPGPQFSPTVLSVPSSRDPNKRTAISSLSPDRPCWPKLVVTAYEKDDRRVKLCDAVVFGVAAEGVAELEKFLGYLGSSRSAAVVRLDASTKAYVPAQTIDATAPALVLRPFHAPRAA